MTFRSPSDAAIAHKDQAEFTRFETASILANILPNSDMNSSEVADLHDRLRFIEELAEARRKFGQDALFSKLVR